GCSVEIAGGVVTQGPGQHLAAEVGGEADGHGLGGPPDRAEEQPVGRADGDADSVEVVAGLPTAPGGFRLDEGDDREGPAGGLLGADGGNPVDVGRGRPPLPAPRGEVPQPVVVVVEGQADLLEVVGALDAGGGVADLLHCRQQKAHQDGDDGNDDQ